MSDLYINETRVDLDRCKLYRDGETVSLEPKVIQVLHYLARHQGQVVSHSTLLDAIWTNTVVEASALQRCIAQLRKAFNDDARQPKIIATYPKKGYSLIAKVSQEMGHQVKPATKISFSTQALAACLLAGFVLIFAGLSLASRSAQTPEPDTNIAASPETTRPAPSTPAQEASLLTSPALLAAIGIPDNFPVYSPDGRYVVFPRYLDERKAHLWARDLAYGNDFLLTEEAGVYEHLAWSRDGSQLLFVDATCLTGAQDSCLIKQCSSLKSVALSQSETNSLLVEKLIDCSPLRLVAPVWLNPETLAVIEVNAEEAALVQYDVKTLARTTLYKSNEVIPYHLSYSRPTKILTIMSINSTGRKELLFLDINTGKLNKSDRVISVPDENWYPSSNPL